MIFGWLKSRGTIEFPETWIHADYLRDLSIVPKDRKADPGNKQALNGRAPEMVIVRAVTLMAAIITSDMLTCYQHVATTDTISVINIDIFCIAVLHTL